MMEQGVCKAMFMVETPPLINKMDPGHRSMTNITYLRHIQFKN